MDGRLGEVWTLQHVPSHVFIAGLSAKVDVCYNALQHAFWVAIFFFGIQEHKEQCLTSLNLSFCSCGKKLGCITEPLNKSEIFSEMAKKIHAKWEKDYPVLDGY